MKVIVKFLTLISFLGVNSFSSLSMGYGENEMAAAKAVTSADRTKVAAPDIRNSAGNAGDQQKGGAGSNAAMSQGLNMGGTALISAGTPLAANPMTTGTGLAMIAGGVVLMAMGMMAGQQAKEDNKTAGLSYDARNGFNSANGLDKKGVNTEDNPNNDPNASAQFKANQKKLAKLGFKVDPKKMTITTPQGKEIKAKDLMTEAGAMAATGISAQGYKDIMAKANDIMTKAVGDLKSSNTADMYGDGGGFGGGSKTVIVDEDANANGLGAGDSSAGKNLAARGPAEVSGLTKNFNGELIGVSADSIFAMMTRRYILKDKQNFFLSDAEVAKPTGR